MKRYFSLFAVSLLSQSLVASLAIASQPPLVAQQPAATSDSGWAGTSVGRGIKLLFYQPQVENWHDNRIEGYAAVAVQGGGSGEQNYGVVQFIAKTEVDKVNRLVTLYDFKIT